MKCFLLLGKVPFDVKPLNLGKGENKTPEMKQLNWTCKLPFIVDPSNSNFRVFESHAIMKYVHAKYTLADSLYPRHINARTNIDMYLDWHHSNTRKTAHAISTCVLSKRTGATKTLYDPELILADMDHALNDLNDHFLNNPTNFITGSASPTIADLSCYFELTEHPLLERGDLTSEYANIAKFIRNMQQIQQVNQVDKEFNDIVAKIFKKK